MEGGGLREGVKERRKGVRMEKNEERKRSEKNKQNILLALLCRVGHFSGSFYIEHRVCMSMYRVCTHCNLYFK